MKKLLATLVLIVSFTAFSSAFVKASVNTGNAGAYQCVYNTIQTGNGPITGFFDNNGDPCNPSVTPTATPTPTTGQPTPTDTPNNPGGPGDGRSDNMGCSVHDCSNQSHPVQAVLGLSSTNGDNQYIQFAELVAALGLSSTGLYFLKRNAN